MNNPKFPNCRLSVSVVLQRSYWHRYFALMIMLSYQIGLSKRWWCSVAFHRTPTKQKRHTNDHSLYNPLYIGSYRSMCNHPPQMPLPLHFVSIARFDCTCTPYYPTSVLGLRRPSRWVGRRHPPATPSSSSRATHAGLPHPPSFSGDAPAASSSLCRSRSLLALPGTKRPLAVFASVVTACNLHTQAPRRMMRRRSREF